MRPIRIVSLGRTERPIVEMLRDGLESRLHTAVEIAGSSYDLEEAYDPERLQYNSTAIVSGLERLRASRGGTATVIGVTGEDLFIPILTFVFGEAQLGGEYGVVSYHRLLNARYGLPSDHPLEAERLLKEALHEFGHICGLVHCRKQECVMRASSTVEEIDIKGGMFCPECALGVR